jgi:NAD dependent epimerase/dehydratase family
MMGENGRNLIVVTGAGGFIGGSLVSALRARGCTAIRGIDIKPLDQWYQRFDDVENLTLDLNLKENCEIAARGAHEIYNLAANMGGMGFIEHNKALCMLSVLINTHMLQAALKQGVERYFYSSSACVYNAEKQKLFEAPSLKEEDAYPALAEDGYGKSCFPSGCAAISAKTTGSERVSPAFTTSTVPGARGTAAVKRPQRQSAEKLSKQSSMANTKSRFGAVGYKLGALCTLMTA